MEYNYRDIYIYTYIYVWYTYKSNFDTEYFYSVKRLHFSLRSYVLKNYIKLSQRMYRVGRTNAWKLYSLSNYLTHTFFLLILSSVAITVGNEKSDITHGLHIFIVILLLIAYNVSTFHRYLTTDRHKYIEDTSIYRYINI